MMAWHSWMLVRLQLAALHILNCVAQGLAWWLLRAWAVLVAGLALMAALLVVGANGAGAAAVAWVASISLRRARGVALASAHVRYTSGTALLRILDVTESALKMAGMPSPPSLATARSGRGRDAAAAASSQTAEAAAAEPEGAAVIETSPSGEEHESYQEQQAKSETPKQQQQQMPPLLSRDGIAYRLHWGCSAARWLIHEWVMPRDESMLSEQAEEAAEAALDEGSRQALADAEAATDRCSRLAAAALIALGDAVRAQAVEASRLLGLPLPTQQWFLASAHQLATDTALRAFSQYAGQWPAAVLKTLMGQQQQQQQDQQRRRSAAS